MWERVWPQGPLSHWSFSLDYQIDDEVFVNGKVLTKDNQLVTLNNALGVIKKVDGDCVYVETELGVHYLPEDQVSLID